ncbi:MAG: serine hydrolase [Chitinophagaceae bacterium]|nr:serine hydrolase [Chitinophagaceae bacterium]
MKKILLALCLLIAIQFIHAQKKQVKARIKSVENGLIPLVPVKGFKSWTIEERMKHHNIPGVSIAVINNFKVEWVKAYGWADTVRKIPMTTQTMLSAGSISKMLMAAGALKMVEQQKLHLDQPINQFLSSWKLGENDFTAKTPVTLRMLLSHTAGTSQSAYFGYEADLARFPSLVEILDGRSPDGTRRVAVVKEPNTGFQYSGGGSLVAQLAMMDVSKMAFEPLMRSLVFDPLGMSAATFEQPLTEKYAKRASWGYQDVSWYKGTPYVYPQQAAAGLYATAGDLAKFIVDLQLSYYGRGKILSKDMLKQMMQPQAIFSEGNVSKEQIAVGPFLYQRPDNTEDKGIYFNFDGANAGFIASAMGNLTEGYGVVIMVNSGNDYNGLCKELRRAVAKTYGWYKFLPDEITPVQLDTVLLNSYTGRYRKNENEVVYVSREGDHLLVRYNNSLPIYTFPMQKDTVVFTDYNIKGWFSRNAQGQVTGIQNQYQTQAMPRMKDDEFSIEELFNLKRYEDAKVLLRKINADENQLTYLAYEKSKHFEAAKAILEVAEERFPNSVMVLANFAKLYLLYNNRSKALEYGERALKIDPANKELREQVQLLKQ